MTATEATAEAGLWAAVTANPADFATWQVLIQHVDRAAELARIRRAYDAFLAEYPLCYVYWKKYADHVATLTAGADADAVVAVYERAVAQGAARHSVEMWAHYCALVSERATSAAAASDGASLADAARDVFERAVAAVGLDFGAFAVWERYVDFELACGAYERVQGIFQRALAVPLDQAQALWDRYRLYACSRPLPELLLPEERAEYDALLRSSASGDGGDRKEKEEEAEREMRGRVMDARERTFKTTLDESSLRKGFEQIVLKRPYFHVKPMSDVYLTNWRKYLEWETARCDHARIVKLYERCIVSACLYPEFWFMYTAYLERTGNVDAAREVFLRATTIFLKRKPELHLAHAAFEEAHGNAEAARAAYTRLVQTIPGHAESFLRFAAFERRQEQVDSCCEVYERAIAQITEARHNAFLILHYARFLERAATQTSAREIYRQALEKHSSIRSVWSAAIAFETSLVRGCVDTEAEQRVHELFARAVSADCPLSDADKRELWDLWAEFAADWGSDVALFRCIDEDIFAAKKGGKPHCARDHLAAVSSSEPSEPPPKVQRRAPAAAAAARTAEESDQVETVSLLPPL